MQALFPVWGGQQPYAPVHLAILKACVAAGADVDAFVRSVAGSHTLLHMCSQEGLPEVAHYLLTEAGAAVDPRDYDGDTPLHIACREFKTASSRESSERRLNVARILIEQGANLGAQNRERAAPLLVAASNNAHDIMSMLINHGADLAGLGPEGARLARTALTFSTLRCRAGCGKEAKSQCSRCKVVSYCGRECQLVDWRKAHKRNCQPSQ